ncbi:hypothetical protein C2W62_38700 [Candidatus Entotheonella serta]|nr:hypothetical protein C2W62_38700 [Candidatus Entotheonella serta]
MYLLPGDRIRVEKLRLHPVRNFQNPGRFDFRTHMHRQGIYAVGGISRPERVRLLERPQHWRLDRLFAQWRQDLLQHIRDHLSSPADAVLAAIVLGQHGALTPDIERDFRAAGLAHLLVVSRLHVGFIVLASFVSLRTLLRYLRSWAPRSWLPAWRPTPTAALLSMTPLLFYFRWSDGKYQPCGPRLWPAAIYWRSPSHGNANPCKRLPWPPPSCFCSTPPPCSRSASSSPLWRLPPFSS